MYAKARFITSDRILSGVVSVTAARPIARTPHSIRTRAAALVLIIPALTLLGVNSTPPATSAESSPPLIGIQLLEAPANAIDDPRAHIYIVDHTAPGTVLHRKIRVTNSGTSAQPVSVYAAGAKIVNETFTGDAGRDQNELSSWTSISPEVKSVPAKGASDTEVTITIPSDAAPGERYGVVWVEAASPPDQGGAITAVSRVGIRLYVSVGIGAPPAANFTITELAATRSAQNELTVNAMVKNTGGRALDITGSLTLSNGPGGLNAGPFTVTLGSTIALGTTEPVNVVIDSRLPAGPWTAEFKLKSGLVEQTATGKLTFPLHGSGPSVAAHSTNPTSSWFLLVGSILGMIGVGIFFVWLISRRRRVRTSQPGHVPLRSAISRHRAVG